MTEFVDLPADTIREVAEYAAALDPDVELVDDDVEDTDAPHGVNTVEEMHGDAGVAPG